MWVFTTSGFYSVVAHRTRHGHVIVRARTREDIEALSDRIRGLKIQDNAGSDYRFRAEVRKADWQNALASLAGAIDYHNFKNTVAERQGHDRARIYSGVWSLLRALQVRDG